MRRPIAVVLGLVLSVGLTGCIGLPDDGPVVEAQTFGSGDTSDAMAISAEGPQPGQTRSEVVKGFLDAMQATPIDDTVAREFLTTASRDQWQPDRVIVYDDISLPQPGIDNLVNVTLVGADLVDERGSWQGALDVDKPDHEQPFTVVPEGDDFRIAGPPNVLIVPQDWYAERFRQASLYFFEPTSQVLVPDPVFVPREVDLASILVQRLAAGPVPELAENLRNLLPAGVDPELEVEVSDAGVATVNLTGEGVVMPRLADRSLLVAQLAWTLRQDSSVERLRIEVDGEPVSLPGEDTVSVTAGEEFAPYATGADTLLFGLDDGRMVSGAPSSLVQVDGPFGTGDLDLRSITPDLLAQRAAGVSASGTEMYVGPVSSSDDAVTAVVTGATDLLAPAWDFSGRLWMVDRGSDGAVVSYLRRGRAEEIDIPNVTGEDVKSFLVSRDGSRFVAVIHREGTRTDELVVSRLRTSSRGRVEKPLPARQVDVEGGLGLRIKDIAWLSPTTIVVLHPRGDDLFQIRTASVDGAPGGVDDLSLTLDGPIRGLAGTPNPRQSTYAISEGQLVDLSRPSDGDIEVAPGITSLGYVG